MTDTTTKAFPHEIRDFDSTKGMTLRDYFAAKAMQGGISHNRAAADPKDWAKWSYKVADAMMEARKA